MKHVTQTIWRRARVILVLSLTLSMLHCGDDGAQGQDSLYTLTTVEPGAECADGGIRIDVGLDTDLNGRLDADEITDTTFACNGSSGAPGANGADGADGSNGVDGTDGTNGGTGSTGTDGSNPLTVITALSDGDPDCPDGGVRFETGLDDGDPGGTASNGVLEADEIDHTRTICNGTHAFNDQPVEPPLEPAGMFILNTSGGNGLDASGGNGGHGGDLLLEMTTGSIQGHIKVFETGVADASFDFPTTVPVYLGDNALDVITDVTVVAVADHGTLGNGIAHTHIDGNRVYLRDDAADDGHTVVTGISVGTGSTLTFEPNNAAATTATFILANDLSNSGTLTVSPLGGSTDRGNLSTTCLVYYSPAGSSVNLAGGEEGAGGDLELDIVSFVNEGLIDTSGGNGPNGGNGGSATIAAYYFVVNTGDIDASGGTGESGAGGGADPDGITITTLTGDLFNSGFLSTAGGSATGVARNAGPITLETLEVGSITNSGNLLAAGGDSAMDCSSSCLGGAGAPITLSVSGGVLTSSGYLATNGGFGATGNGGAGGDITIDSETGEWHYGATVPTGDVVISGNMNTSGGDGSSGGNGGAFYLSLAPGDYPQGQEIVLFGYTNLSTGGGDGTENGGHGGDINVLQDTATSASGSGASGGFANYTDIDASGGNGAEGNGGNGGQLTSTLDDYFSWQTSWERITNYGNIDLSGGDAENLGGNAGFLFLWGNNGVENHGLINASGGNSTDGTGGDGEFVWFFADLAPIINTGAIDTAGGDCTAEGGDGGPADNIIMEAASVENSGALSAAGGDGGATGEGQGGHAADVQLYSFEGATDNSASIDVTGGSAQTAGNHGLVFIDGTNATDLFLGE